MRKMGKGGCVYIMTNDLNTVLYTGVTSDLMGRIWKHKINFYPKSFSARCKCYKLVYYCYYGSIVEAIAEEKRIKGGNRRAKLKLIKELNPQWKDLYDTLV